MVATNVPFDSSSDPMIQKMMLWMLSEEVIDMRNIINDEDIKLIITPISSIRFMLSPPFPEPSA